MIDDRTMFTVDETARELCRPTAAVRYWAKKLGLKQHRLGAGPNSRVLFDRETVAQLGAHLAALQQPRPVTGQAANLTVKVGNSRPRLRSGAEVVS